jgi:hypothetical protein
MITKRKFLDKLIDPCSSWNDNRRNTSGNNGPVPLHN